MQPWLSGTMEDIQQEVKPVQHTHISLLKKILQPKKDRQLRVPPPFTSKLEREIIESSGSAHRRSSPSHDARGTLGATRSHTDELPQDTCPSTWWQRTSRELEPTPRDVDIVDPVKDTGNRAISGDNMVARGSVRGVQGLVYGQGTVVNKEKGVIWIWRESRRRASHWLGLQSCKSVGNPISSTGKTVLSTHLASCHLA